MADEQLRLQATVVDQFSRPLTDLKNKLRDVSNSNASGMRGMTRDWQNIGQEVGRVNLSLRNQLAPALSGMAGLSFGVGGAFASMAAGVAATAAGLKNFGASTQALSLFSRETGIAVDQVRAFGALGERWGTSAETMQGALKNMASGMYDLRRRSGELYGTLHGMGLQDLAEDMMKGTNQEAIAKVFDRLAKIPDPEVRRRLSMLVFGTEDIGAIAAQEGGNYEKVIAAIKARIGTLGPEAEKSARQFQGNLAEIQQSMENLKNQALGPLIEEVNKWWAAVDKPGLVTMFNDGLGLVKGTIETTRKEIEAIQRVWDRLSGNGPVTVDDPRGATAGRKSYLEQEIKKLESGDIGLGGAARPQEVQRKIDRLNDELRQLTDELKKQGSGANAQKSSFAPSGGMGGLIQQASLGGFGGGRIFGGPGGGTAGLGGGYTGGTAGPGMAPPLQGAGPRSAFGGGFSGKFTGTGDRTLDAIIAAEGTAKGGRDPFNTVLGYGRYGTPPKPLTEMTLREAYAFGRQVRAKHGSSSALGAFQIVGQTMKTVGMPGAGLTWDDKFSPENQMAMAHAIRRKQGLGAWEGFKNNPAALAQARQGGTYPLARPDDTGGGGLGRAFGNRMMGLPTAAQPQKVDANGTVNIHLEGMPNYKARTSMDGLLFKEVNLNKGRSMAMAEDI